jgi:RNA polymerase sigma-70 factor, ECF subfamily
VTDQGAGCCAPENDAPVAAAHGAESLTGLVAAVAAGESSALAELYDSTVAKVHTLVRAIVRSAADAEEVTCDVYMQAWQTAGQFDASRGTVMAWLLMMARSRALDSLRRQRSRARLFDEQFTHEEVPDVAESVSPERMLSLFQRGSAVHTALEELAPRAGRDRRCCGYQRL